MTSTDRPLLVALARNDRAALQAHRRHGQVVLAVTLLGVAAGSFSNSLLVAALPQVAAPLVSILLILGYGVSYPLLFLTAALVSLLGAVLVHRIKTVA